jgi:hypothetical protein
LGDRLRHGPSDVKPILAFGSLAVLLHPLFF